MGIRNLLKILRPIVKQKHLSEFSKMKLAIDGYAWLHKSVFSMITLNDSNSTAYLNYLIKRVNKLISFNIKLVIVFDGNRLPMKENEELKRENQRQALLKQSEDLLKKNNVQKAIIKKAESIDITPKMAYEFIQLIKKMQIEYYVAPYEADAQLAYLSKINIVDGVITEDSDILALGCKRVLLKLDNSTCLCEEILYENISKVSLGDYDFRSFDEDKFLSFCIMCGCDYFKFKNVGIKNAYKAFRDTLNYQDAFQLLQKKQKKSIMDSNFISLFERAFITFRFHIIYCPIEKRMRYFNNMNEKIYPFMKNITDYSFLGEISDNELTQQIVFGEIDPITYEPFNKNKSNPKNCNVKKSNWNKKNNRSLKEIDKTQTRLSLDMFKSQKSQEDIEPNSNKIYKTDNSVINKQSIPMKLGDMKLGNTYSEENDDFKTNQKPKIIGKRKYDDFLYYKLQNSNSNKEKNITSTYKNETVEQNQCFPQTLKSKFTFELLIASYDFTQSPSTNSHCNSNIKENNSNWDNNSNSNSNSNCNTNTNTTFNQNITQDNKNNNRKNLINKLSILKPSIIKPKEPPSNTLIKPKTVFFPPQINSILFNNTNITKDKYKDSNQFNDNSNELPSSQIKKKDDNLCEFSKSSIKSIIESTRFNKYDY